MKKRSLDLPANGPGRRVWLLLTLSIVLMALGAFQPSIAWADAGPFPTRTPTRTPEPTETLTSTPEPTPTATSTFTPTPTTGVILGIETPLPVTPIVASPTPTAVPAGVGSTLFACWPIALIIILAVIIASTYFLTRRARPEEAAY